jgi:hypothetical protein
MFFFEIIFDACFSLGRTPSGHQHQRADILTGAGYLLPASAARWCSFSTLHSSRVTQGV